MNMRYTLTFLEEQFDRLRAGLTDQDGHEKAAYLYCGLTVTALEKKLTVNEVQIVDQVDIADSSPTHVSVRSVSFIKALSKADRENKSLILVHSHPNGFLGFSLQDDREEKDFFRTAYIRAPNGLHGSMILSDLADPRLVGRLWFDSGNPIMMNRIRVVGKRFRIFDHNHQTSAIEVPIWSDRQVKAFGKEVQKWLNKLHIGIVGAGGTGSAISEQLIRLGVSKLTVIDDQSLEDTNVTRLYGSRLSDVGRLKVDLIKRLADDIGFGTEVIPIKGSVCEENTAKSLRDCDIIFCCTDDANGRMILNRLAIWHLIPVIDMGIAIDSVNGVIKDITGRVTILIPSNACLLCRGGSKFQEQLSAEALKRSRPEEYKQRVKEKYASELSETDPSIIMFTTDIASRAMIIFLQMLTGFMGAEWTATETLERYHETDIELRMGKNSRKGRTGCFCMDKSKFGIGDGTRFLGRMW